MGRRNFQGGNKTKSMAKGVRVSNNELRKKDVDNVEEEYVLVTSVLGNGRFRVINSDNVEYTAILPGSMKGHKKRNFYVNLHSHLLINNRSSWQTIKRNATVDIIHVYSASHANTLQLGNILPIPSTFQQHSTVDILFSNNNNHTNFNQPSSTEQSTPITTTFDIQLI